MVNLDVIKSSAFSAVVLDPVHTRADPFGSVPKLVRIGLPCTREHSYPIQFGSAIRTRLVRIKKACLFGSDPLGSRVHTWIGHKQVRIENEAIFQ